ncbi:hypothetical protein CASFOL_027760 [Castilleja foliolosa]|uniref:F-box associated beta-propeller type 3 domain-containing protein n=1 Tax=Castilleja foliolosa TaxID=1961234 RepID=A0ABD3CHI4_9LAMI
MPHRKTSESSTGDAMADCVLPLDMIALHRFKSVCKPLRDVLSSPEFAKMHRAQFPLNPENQSVVIYRHFVICHHTVSLLKIETDEEKKPTDLDIPFSQDYDIAQFVGCCNGLLCLAFIRRSQFIALWNPALNNMIKYIPFPDLKVEGPAMLSSLGFGYNEEADDFKVIIIVELEKNKEIRVEVYSSNSNSWSTIDVGFRFTVLRHRNSVIVNGSPYWLAMVDEKHFMIVCFDVRKMVFKVLPLPKFIVKGVRTVMLVDLKGDLGVLVCKQKKDETVLSFDIWVFDDAGKNGWTKNRSFGPIELKVYRFLHCSKNGKILVGKYLEFGKVVVLDTESGGVEEIVIDEFQRGAFQIHDYTESLAYIKGMETLL